MTRQNAVHVLAGTIILVGVVLGLWVNQWWYLLAGFVGLNLFQSGFTGFCPAETIFGWLGLSDCPCAPASPHVRART
jgi:hypothetical protein